MKILKIFLLFSIVSIIFMIPLNTSYAFQGNEIREHCLYTMDEEYLYRLYEDYVEIVKINNYDDMEFEGRIHVDKMQRNNLLVYGDRLLISGIKSTEDETSLSICLYDIFNKNNPLKISEFELEGYDYLIKENDGVVYCTLQQKEGSIKIISMDLNSKDMKYTLNSCEGVEGNFIYLSENDLYIICSEDMIDRRFTTIYKFYTNRDELKYVNKISFDGSILNEKFINEYEDNLRVLTYYENYNNKIYIFDKDLKNVNSIDVILENENVNNVYFDGETCYISGFLKDGYLSIYNLNYNNPKEMGRIKLTSSLNYIYKLGEDKFVVIGNEHRSDTYKNIQTDKSYEIVKNIGIKINLIDVLDKENPKIFDEYFIRGKEVYSSAFNDEGKLLYSSDKNILAFPLNISDYNLEMDVNTAMEVNSSFVNNDKLFTGIYVFDLDNEKGIGLKFVINSDLKVIDYEDIYGITIYKESIFVFREDSLEIFSLNGDLLGECRFKKEETT